MLTHVLQKELSACKQGTEHSWHIPMRVAYRRFISIYSGFRNGEQAVEWQKVGSLFDRDKRVGKAKGNSPTSAGSSRKH